MGDFTLGCLLGQYDKAQSFDVASAAAGFASVNSWAISTGSGAFQLTDVHSSAQGVQCLVGSRGAAHSFLQYDHAAVGDAYARWFPDVTTHAIRTDFRARLFGNTASGGVYADYLNVGVLTLPRATTLQALRTSDPAITSGAANGAPIFRFVRNGQALTTSVGMMVDDVLTQIDPITLNPTWDYQEMAQVLAAQNRTLGGNLSTYQWAKHFEYAVPLVYLSTSYADLLNWWWENRFNLALTLNTSDTESIRVVRIVNDRQPIGRRMQPYADQWQGLLQLESIDKGSLVF